ncbi:MAG: thiamine phosphate synthase [Puniceicoccaceae bacterium]|nr:MAG: thiamine phosphate synthase [Puniceicoccaceae bacterium]
MGSGRSGRLFKNLPEGPAMTYPSIQCLTIDHSQLSHGEQIAALCAAGAEWIQLRMKGASDAEVTAVAEAALPVCRAHQCRLIINDKIDVALAVGADGVHLGKDDLPWVAARERAGTRLLIGGTVNSAADAQAAVDCGCLDYVGVGPFRFTQTKQKLAPVLSPAQWREILDLLAPLPAFAIGGITAADVPDRLPRGLAGIAVSGTLYQDGDITANYQALLKAYAVPTTQAP